MRKIGLLALFILLVSIPAVAFAALTEPEIYQSMLSLRGEYYEGRPWTNANYYGWNGGYYSGGYGCAGFAFRLSDEAFGSNRCRFVYEIDYDTVRVGDILRINNDTHSVIVLEKHDSYVVIAEGNYNSSIHWGRSLTKEKVEASDYVLTRYPANAAAPTSGSCGDTLSWSYQDGILKIEGSGPMWDFKSVFGNGRMDAPWQPFASAVKTIEIASDLSSVGYGAFEDCSQLREVCYDGTASQWELVSIAGCNAPLASAEMQFDVEIPEGLLTAQLPDGLQRIADEAFLGAGFELVEIPDSCQSVGSRAFANCKQLQYVRLSRGTSIADDAFAGCDNVILVYSD